MSAVFLVLDVLYDVPREVNVALNDRDNDCEHTSNLFLQVNACCIFIVSLAVRACVTTATQPWSFLLLQTTKTPRRGSRPSRTGRALLDRAPATLRSKVRSSASKRCVNFFDHCLLVGCPFTRFLLPRRLSVIVGPSVGIPVAQVVVGREIYTKPVALLLEARFSRMYILSSFQRASSMSCLDVRERTSEPTVRVRYRIRA